MRFIVNGLKNHTTGIYISGKRFKSLQEIKSIFAKILKSYKPEEIVKEEDEELLKGLLQYHTKAQEKLQNFKCFEVNFHEQYKETKCFFIVKESGDKEDFSYVQCIKNISKELKD